MKIKHFLKIQKPKTEVLHLQWSHVDSLLAFSDLKDKGLYVWDISKKREIFDFAFQNPIKIIYWALNDKVLFCSDSYNIYQVNLETLEILKMKLVPSLRDFAFFNSHKAMIGIDSDTLYLLETFDTEWKIKRKFQLECDIHAFCFNQKRKIVACYYPNNIEIYNMNLELETKLSNKIFNVEVLEWNPEGTSLYIGDYYGNIIQWEINKHDITFKEKFIDMDKYTDIYYDPSEATLYFKDDQWFPQSLDHYYDPKFEYLLEECINRNFGEPIHDIKFHPFGNYYAIAPNLNRIFLFQYPENKKINEINEFNTFLEGIAWSSNGKYIATSSHNGHIYVWKFKEK